MASGLHVHRALMFLAELALLPPFQGVLLMLLEVTNVVMVALLVYLIAIAVCGRESLAL